MSLKTLGYFMPGELIGDIMSKDRQTVIGPGLLRSDDHSNCLVASTAGVLHHKAPNIYWIESKCRRYIPKKGDLVVGIVTKKSTESLRIDIGSAEPVLLSMLAFEGATKKMKPDVNVGDCVYAKLLSAHKEMEPELVCVDQYFKAKTLGVLSNDGHLISVSINLAQILLNGDNPLLRTLAKKFPYEIAVGVNGKVWIKANKCQDILTLCRALEAADKQSENAIVAVCQQH